MDSFIFVNIVLLNNYLLLFFFEDISFFCPERKKDVFLYNAPNRLQEYNM